MESKVTSVSLKFRDKHTNPISSKFCFSQFPKNAETFFPVLVSLFDVKMFLSQTTATYFLDVQHDILIIYFNNFISFHVF